MFDKSEFISCINKCFYSNNLSGLTDIQLEKFYNFANILAEVNQSMNLTAIADMHGICLKHFTDSVLALNYLPDKGRIADIGCGGGFPVIPLAIMRPDLHFVAIDSTSKKLEFTRSACSACGIDNVDVVCGRAEELSVIAKYREQFDCVISRAVADLQVLSELCIPFVKNGGIFVALKGKNGLEEANRSQKAANILGCEPFKDISFDLLDDSSFESRHIVTTIKVRPTDSRYPRSYPQIKKKPL